MKCCFEMLCRLVVLALITSKDIFLNKRGHVWPPVVALDQFDRAVFARVSGSGRVVTCLDDFTAEFVVIWYIQFAFVVQQTVEIFPLEYAVSETSRAFLLQDDEGLSNFSFSLGAFANALFESRGLGEGSCGDGFEVFGSEDDSIVVVLGVCDLVFWKA